MSQVTTPATSRSEWASHDGFDVVTGAFSYSGAAIARELQAAGRISAARPSAAGLGYRGPRRGQVSAANARLRSTAIGLLAARPR